MALHPLLSAGPAGSAGAAWAERRLLLRKPRNASATWLQQDIRACLCVSVYMWSQKVRRPDDSLLPCRLLPAGLGRAGVEGMVAGTGSAARHGLLSSVPDAAVFGSCPEAVAAERAAGRGFFSTVYGPGPEAAAAGRDLATDMLLPSFLPPPLLTQLSCFMLPTASLREAKLCSVMVPHIPSKTVGQTLPPVGRGRAGALVVWAHCLVTPLGLAGCMNESAVVSIQHEPVRIGLPVALVPA